MKKCLIMLSFCCPALTLGCGSANNPLVEVKGKIQFKDGSNLPAGTVLRFDPQQGDRQTATAETAADGTFTLEHTSGSSGIEIGDYRIAVLPPKGDSGGFHETVPESYIDGNALTAEIKEGAESLDLKVDKLVKGKR